MMWLEAILSSVLILSAVILYLQIPEEKNNLLDFYNYLYLSDQIFIHINSNLTLFCLEPENPNICLKCNILSLDGKNIINESFSNEECRSHYYSKQEFILTTNQLFYHNKELKKMSISIFYKN